jgi:hypothetical protein
MERESEKRQMQGHHRISFVYWDFTNPNKTGKLSKSILCNQDLWSCSCPLKARSERQNSHSSMLTPGTFTSMKNHSFFMKCTILVLVYKGKDCSSPNSSKRPSQGLNQVTPPCTCSSALSHDAFSTGWISSVKQGRSTCHHMVGIHLLLNDCFETWG